MSDSDGESIAPQEAPVDILMRAVRNGESLQAVRSTLEATQIHVDDLMRVIIFAIETSADGDVICALIQHDPETARAPPNERHPSLLHLACWSRHKRPPIQVIRLLIEMNPNALAVSSPDFFGFVPLHCACWSRYASLEVVKFLLSHRPEASMERDLLGNLPLHRALHFRASDEVALHLIACFPDAARIANRHSEYPLHLAATSYQYSLNVVRKLVDIFPESLSLATIEGHLPLHLACERRVIDVEVVQFLMEKYPDAVRARARNGSLPLHALAESWDSSIEAMQLLVDQYPDAAMAADYAGKLPIHNACNQDGISVESLRLLLDSYPGNEVDHMGLNVSDNRGRVPLHYAAGISIHDENADELEWRDDVAPIAVLQLLLNRFPKGVWSADNAGKLPLHALCSVERNDDGLLPHIRLMLEVDCFTILHARHDGKTPLQLAFARGQGRRTRQFLLEKQDEALRLFHEAFAPTANHYGLPSALVLSEIWPFVLPPLWRPTRAEMNRGG